MNKKIPVIITIFLIVLTLTSLYFKNDITAVLKNYEYKASLSAERQEVYDKMQIEYVNIKNRITGTAPFNEGTTSNENGTDVSEKDKYGLVLENFHEMKEDMNIVVKFEKVEENPNTGSFINYIVLISVPLSLGIFKFIKNKKKLIKL